MATTSLYKGSEDGITSCEFTIADLSADWNDSNYIQVGLATSSVTSGQSSAPSGIKGSVSAPSSGTLRSVDGVASGLEPGKTVTLYGFAQASNNLYYPAGSDTFTTELEEISGLTLTSQTSSSLSFDWNNVSGANLYRWLSTDNDSYTDDGTVTNSNKTLSGLTAGVLYDFAVRAEGDDDNTLYSELTNNATLPSIPSISHSSSSDTSITVNVTKGSGNADSPKVYWKKTTDSTYNSGYTFPSFGSCTITGLDSDTSYDIYAKAVIELNSTDYFSSNSSVITASTSGGRPTNFSWTYSTISSGTAAVVDHRDWNNLNDKINEFRTYKGFATYSYTTVSTDNDFLATYFNLARSKIDDMNSTGLSNKSSGDDLKAADLNLLVTKLNDIT